ncbi:hypothetical protein D9611_009425 [Ephemerocybe angulata]|uniref:NAD-P-binding protein n=1 Tax=Ephemerocybe angulata TaxID=980116 RepID=A0A8H5AVG9_9AGAR|nr:hypothetical protein D9611_009425 [Tulosesus angulatus]
MPRSLVSTVQATTSFLKEAWFQGTPTWTTADIPDLSGQVFIVTGGNSGLGKDTVRALLEHEARVYVASRDEKRSLAAIDELFEQTGRRALFLQLDLADLKSVKMAADQFLSKETRLDVLYNNAGVLGTPLDVVANGYDMAFHTHILGPFYLTTLLLPLLTATAKLRPDQNARVVNLTSSAHHLVGSPPLEFDTFKDGPERRKREDLAFFYCQSKFATILFSNELSRRYKDQGIVSIAVNPGNFSTSLQRRMNESSVHSFLTEYCLFLYPGEWGSITQLWAGTAPEALEASGKYVAPWGRIGQPHPETEDVELAVKLWVYLEEQINDV